MTTEHTSDPTNFLRQSLRANACFSTLSGITFLFASRPIAAFLGDIQPVLVMSTGAQLLLFAGALFWLSARPQLTAPLPLTVIVADLLWVIGTAVVVYAGVFTRGGNLLALFLADVVLLLAILQSIGVHRLRTAARTSEV